MKAYKVTVTDTVVNLVPKDDLNRPVYLQIEAKRTVYVGGSNVTAAQGFPIVKHTAPIHFQIPVNDGLWAVCAAAETDFIRIMTIDSD